MEENNGKTKKSTKYLLIGTLVLFLSILGVSMAYYLARVSGNLSGRAAGTELTINVEKLSTNANMDLIPLDNDLETLQLAATGYDDKGACVDINGYSVCQIYHITLTNKGSVPLTVNGTVTLSGQNVPNIDCATMTNATTVANNNSCMGANVFVSGDTLPANDHNDYYVMVYIKNLDEPQTDSGEFNGTVTFTTEDGRKVKGRFTKPFNLVNHITNLYNGAEKTVVGAEVETCLNYNPKSGQCIESSSATIDYHYATNVNLMNDRLGGTTESLDGGNIRYYGAEPNNWIDIGDTYFEGVKEVKNWESVYGKNAPFSTSNECNTFFNCKDNWQNLGMESEDACNTAIEAALPQMGFESVEQLCYSETKYVREPILWRIIGVFDGKLRIRRDESIGGYSFDTSASDVNNGYGINEWSQADLMKLLNPGYETNTDFDNDGTTKIAVNNSLYWNSGSGKCYSGQSYANTNCDFTNTGLSNEAKEYVVDQTLYLGGFDTTEVSANQAYALERDNNVVQNPSDGVTRTLSWKGKVGLMYPSDFGYAADLSNADCQGNLRKVSLNSCPSWMKKDLSFTVSPWSETAYYEIDFYHGLDGDKAYSLIGGMPTLLLDSSVLAESGNGTKSTPYVLTK